MTGVPSSGEETQSAVVHPDGRANHLKRPPTTSPIGGLRLSCRYRAGWPSAEALTNGTPTWVTSTIVSHEIPEYEIPKRVKWT